MVGPDIREAICDMGYEDAIVFDNPDYDKAIVGVSDDGRVVYDYYAMIECLMEADGMTHEEAMEFISYNTIRAAAYIENGPIVMYKIDMEDCI